MELIMKYAYAGIGSRKTPDAVLKEMVNIASKLEERDYILRSGGAKGADSAFEGGVTDPKNKEIFTVDDISDDSWTYEVASKLVPLNIKRSFATWKPYTRKLIARNVMQILGRTQSLPVRFVICWCPTNNYQDSSGGGTAYALRLAIQKDITIFNMFLPHELSHLLSSLDMEDKYEKLVKYTLGEWNG
jgi:hypothetical protein